MLIVCSFVVNNVNCLFICSTEHQIFKLRFADWEDVMKVDFTKTTEMIEKRAIELVCCTLVNFLSKPLRLCVCVRVCRTNSACY